MISKDTAEHYVWGKQCDGWHLVQRSDLSVIHERMPAGTDETRHFHTIARQFFFVLTGEATMDVNGTRAVLHPWQGIEIPPGTPHQIVNESTAPVEFLVISQPTTRGDRVEIVD